MSEGVGLPSVKTVDLPMAFEHLKDRTIYSNYLLFCSLVDSSGFERFLLERGW